MKDNTKNIIISVVFLIIIFLTLLLNILKKDNKISFTERRKLAQFPKITSEKLFNGSTSKELGKYLNDQFIYRDFFRKIKYMFNINLYRQKDNNKLYIDNDIIYKMEYPNNKYLIEKNAEKLEEISEKYLKGMNKYFSIVPDKSYYCKTNHLKLDYYEIENILNNKLKDFTYINIFSDIDINDYYRTDIHLKQPNLLKVVSKIEDEMGIKNTTKNKYKENVINDFYGALYGQIGIKLEPDNIVYLTDDVIDNCNTYNYETKKIGKIYDLEKNKKNGDKYDIFLSGATSIIEINNLDNKSGKELLVFSDSFAKSMVPLMVHNYSKIKLIDIRYVDSKILNEFIEFNNQDVLFIYSGLVLNSMKLK